MTESRSSSHADRRALSLLFLLFFQTAVNPAGCQETTSSEPSASTQLDSEKTPGAEDELRRLDRQALLELVHLAKFNVRYQQEINHVAKWRNFVYPAAQEAAYACLLGYSASD